MEHLTERSAIIYIAAWVPEVQVIRKTPDSHATKAESVFLSYCEIDKSPPFATLIWLCSRKDV